jgi:hypothetical protein
MARMNLDDKSRADVRIKRLVLRLKEPRQMVMGRLIDAWWVCYDQHSETVPIDEVDFAAELEGMAEAMVAVGLATHAGDGKVRINGAEDRVYYLVQSSESGRKGGRKRAAEAKRGPGGRFQRSDEATCGGGPEVAWRPAGEAPRTAGPATRPLPLPQAHPHPPDQGAQAAAGDDQGSPGEAVELPADVDPDLAEVLAAAIGARDANQGNVDAKERARQASLEDERRRELQSGRGGRAGVPPRPPAAYRRNGTEVIG